MVDFEVYRPTFEANAKKYMGPNLYDPFQREGDGYFHGDVNSAWGHFKQGVQVALSGRDAEGNLIPSKPFIQED